MVIAVKPQIMDEVLPDAWLVDRAVDGAAVDRCRAHSANLASHLPPGTPIVRAMPNTPAAIGQG